MRMSYLSESWELANMLTFSSQGLAPRSFILVQRLTHKKPETFACNQ